MSNEAVVADPKRPYKTYAAVASAFLSSFLATNAADVPPWAVGLITAAVAGIAVYMTTNPKVLNQKNVVPSEHGYADPLYLLVVVVIIVVLVFVVLRLLG